MRLKGRDATHYRERFEGVPPGFLARDDGARRTSLVSGKMAMVAVIVVAVLCVAVVADYALNQDEIYRGVSAGGVDLGGMSRSEARAALDEHASGTLGEIPLRGAGGAEGAAIPADGIGLRLDSAATADKAYAVGREGGAIAGAWRRLATVGSGGIDPVVDYDPKALRSGVEKVSERLGGDSIESGVRLEGGEVELVEARGGYRVDVAATVEEVEGAIRDLSGEAEIVGETVEPGLGAPDEGEALRKARGALEEPLILAHEDSRWTLSSERVAEYLRVSDGEMALDREALAAELSRTLGPLERDPVDARMVSGERGSVEVEPSGSGSEVRMERLLDEIGTGIFEGRHRYEVPVSTIEPDLTTEEAEAARPNTMLGEFQTSYRVYDEPPRVANLETASEAVDGTILAPGETFSFNEAAAPLARYEPSAVIVNGRIDTALGGGLCQIASTLYMAANYAGLEVVERNPHYAELPYIRPGFDATVWFGSLDLKLRNNTGGYLMLEEKVDEQTGEVVARVYGQATGREVELSSRKLSDNGETTRWRSTRKVVEDGRVVENGTLNTDTYQSLKPQAPAPTGRGA